MRKARRFENIFRFIDELCTIYKPKTDLKKITKTFILMNCNSRRNMKILVKPRFRTFQ